MIKSVKTNKPRKDVKIKLPLKTMCRGLKLANHDETYASITNVCENFKKCVKTSSDNACTKESKCHVRKAIPRFGALIWYKVSDYLANVICSTYGDGVQAKAYAAIGRDLKNFEAYVSTLGWDDFFEEAVDGGGFATLEKFMDIVKKRANLTRY